MNVMMTQQLCRLVPHWQAYMMPVGVAAAVAAAVLQGVSKKFTIKDCQRNNAVVATLVKGATGFLASCM